MPDLKLPEIPEKITREQVTEACRALGLNAEDTIAITIDTHGMRVTTLVYTEDDSLRVTSPRGDGFLKHVVSVPWERR